MANVLILANKNAGLNDPSLAALANHHPRICGRHQVSEASFFSWRRVLRERGLLDHAAPSKTSPRFRRSSRFWRSMRTDCQPYRAGPGSTRLCVCGPASMRNCSSNWCVYWRSRHVEPVVAGRVFLCLLPTDMRRALITWRA